MGSVDYKAFELDSKIKYLEKVAVIKNCYLVIGGGKIGTNFLEYAIKNKFPFVLVIDRDENALASRRAKVLKDESELVSLLKNKAAEPLPEEAIESPPVKEKKQGDNEPEAYFYKMDIRSVPLLFSFGIPEYIIPAVPCHAVALILADLLDFPKPEARINEILINSPRVCEFSISPEDSRLMSFFENIEASFDDDIVAGVYPEQGMIFFSYAREGEICPEGCPGPKESCPTFRRKKPKTVTEYTRELRHTIPGWIFESRQMKPGIGGLKGIELRKNLLEILEFMRRLQENNSIKWFERIENRTFFIATTCTCHGVLNLFCVKQ